MKEEWYKIIARTNDELTSGKREYARVQDIMTLTGGKKTAPDIIGLAKREFIDSDSPFYARDEYVLDANVPSLAKIHPALVLYLVQQELLPIKEQKFDELIAQKKPAETIKAVTAWHEKLAEKTGLACSTKDR